MRYASKLRTVTDAINAKTPTFAAICREKGRDFSEGLLMFFLVYINNILNLKRPLTEEQIEMAAIEIISDFSSLKISDLTLITKRIISGYYGEYYENFNIPKLLTIFREYFEERLNKAAEQSLAAHKDITSEDTFSYSKNVKRILKQR